MSMRRFHTVCLALVVCAVTACGPAGEDTPTPGVDAGTADGGGDAAVSTDPCGPDTRSNLAVIRDLTFVRRDGDVSRGLDLDGRVSDARDPKGCFQKDFVDEDGNEGIDNQLALLVPAIEAVGGQALESVVHRAINEGNVLLMLEMRRVDDPENDACVQVDMLRGKGRPLIGNKDLIEPDQTFDVDEDAPREEVDDATISDGLVTAGPFTLEIPANIAQFDIYLTLRDATLEYRVDQDGTLHGLIAGALVVDELMDILDTIEDGTDLIALIRKVIHDKADLSPDADGNCQRLSVSLEFEATPAFLYADADPEVAR